MTYVDTAKLYATDIIAGVIPTNQWTGLACKRFIKDIGRKRKFPWVLSLQKASEACAFLENLSHTKGRWAKTPLKLEPWQIFIVVNIFGWVHKDTNLRRFNKASLYVARKNGKSLLAAAIGLYMFCEGEAGAEVYSGATGEKQAWEVFKPARLMARNEPELTDAFSIEVNASNLCIVEDESKFEPIIGNPGDGASPHCYICDEYHEHPDSRQYDTMITGMGARLQPLALVITTAGDNIAGPCYDDMLTIQKILQGVIKDERVFGIIYGIDKEDDWTTVEALRKANPNMGVSIMEEFLLARQKEAIENARHQGRFKTKHLNVWVQARDAFFNMQKWAECEDKRLQLDDFAGETCVISVDLASKKDIAEVHVIFPHEDGSFTNFGLHYLPEAAVENEENNHYRAWDIEGHLIVTEGNMIDMPLMKDEVLEMCKEFNVRAVIFDPWHDTYMVTELQAAGIPCVEYAATVKNFSDPMKSLDALILDKKWTHPYDLCMDWMLSNVVARVDAKDNVYPRKERQELKIDGPVALIMAFGWYLDNPDPGPSVYENPDTRVWA